MSQPKLPWDSVSKSIGASLPKTVVHLFRKPSPHNPGSLAEAVAKEAHSIASKGTELKLGLAAGFDLVVAAKYYDLMGEGEWLRCEHTGLLFYPYLNACPACCLSNRFVYVDGHKPESDEIGNITEEALTEILAEQYYISGKTNLSMWRGEEPADLIIVDKGEEEIFFAEVKAAPLYTPALALDETSVQMDLVAELSNRHSRVEIGGLKKAKPSILIPNRDLGYWLWQMPDEGLGRSGWAGRSMVKAIKTDPDKFEKFVNSWTVMWGLYLNRDKSKPIYWLTPGCGAPPMPRDGWPERPKGGARVISDGKTSVGMDRTDDIKKAAFQLLDLGVQLRRQEIDSWDIKIGLMSNLHAGRRYDKYVEPYEDLVWGWKPDEKDVIPDLYNLFDGILTFSKSHIKDEWVKGLVNWEDE